MEEVRAVAGEGLEGDRYRAKVAAGTSGPEQQVTLIESEALEAVAHDYDIRISGADTRRNLLTAGAPLNHLVGREFRVGECVLRGRELSEPCGYLEKMTRTGVTKALLHRGGLRARILQGGVARPGDSVEPVA